MIIFLDENDVEYGALATIKATNAVNGERSLTGTIASGDYVLSKLSVVGVCVLKMNTMS